MSIDLKKDRWFIRVNSVEESIAAQEWLFEQELDWVGSQTLRTDFKKWEGFPKAIGSGHSSCRSLGQASVGWWENRDHQEIKLTFKQKLSVSDVIYPTKDSPQQAKIRELEETINKAQQQIKQLKEEV